MPLLSREDFQALYALEREAGSGLSVAELRKELSLTFPEGARVLTRGSEDYPQALDALADPPQVLCALGDLTLLGESNREPYGSKERRRIEKHGHVGCGREPEAFGNEEEFAHEAEAHERDVAEPDVPVPFLMEKEAVGDEEQNRSRSGAQANLQHGTDVRPGSLDGSLLHAPGHGEENADEKGAKVDGPADGSSWESHD